MSRSSDRLQHKSRAADSVATSATLGPSPLAASPSADAPLNPRSLPENTSLGVGLGLGLGLPILVVMAAYLIWRRRRARSLTQFTGTSPSPMGPPLHTSPPGLSHTRTASRDGYATLGSGTALPVSTGPFELKGFTQKELVLGPGEERTPKTSEVVRPEGVGGSGGQEQGRVGSRSFGTGPRRTPSYSERHEPRGLLRPVGSRERLASAGAHSRRQGGEPETPRVVVTAGLQGGW